MATDSAIMAIDFRGNMSQIKLLSLLFILLLTPSVLAFENIPIIGSYYETTVDLNASGGVDSTITQYPKNNPPANNTPMISGGYCSYDKFRGTGRIISIHQTGESKQQAVYSGYEGFEIKFKFTPVEPMNIENVRWVNNIQDILDREYPLSLSNSWYPGQKYLGKYNITENATFRGDLLLITKGACSPIIFHFDTINTTDFFETTMYNPTPTVTVSSTPTPTVTSTPTTIPTIIPTKKTAGFEFVLAIMAFLLVITIRRNRRK